MKLHLNRAATVGSIVLGAALLGGGGAWASGSLSGDSISQGSIDGSEIQNNSIGSADIHNGSVQSVDVAANSLTGGDVMNGSLTGTDLADGTITGTDIKNGSVGLADLGAGSVGSGQVKDGSITAADLRADTAEYIASMIANGKTAVKYDAATAAMSEGNGATVATFEVHGPMALVSMSATLDSATTAPVRLRVKGYWNDAPLAFSCSASVVAGGYGDSCQASGIVQAGTYVVVLDTPGDATFSVDMHVGGVVAG